MKRTICKVLASALVAASMGTLTSCQEEDLSQSTPMTVKQIYLENASSATTNHDRAVDFARLGQLIRIEGAGFTGLKHIYINGYDTYFNNALLTDNNVWVTLNSKTPVVDADPAERNTIRLTKDETETVYTFTIRAASPYVSGVDNTLPYAGETVTVSGGNLQETSTVTLPGDIVVTDIINDPTGEGEWYSFVMPEGVEQSGHIYSSGANGDACTPDYFNCRQGLIIDFDGTGNQGYWSWSETGSMCDDTDLVTDPLSTGRGNVAMLVPQRLLEAGVIAGKSRAAEWWTAGNGNDADDWTHFTVDDYIPATTPLEELAIQFDIYCPQPWYGTGQMQLTIQNNVSFNGYGSDESKSSTTQTYVWVPWLESGEAFQTESWQTISIALSDFSKYANAIADGGAPTFQSVIDDRAAASYCNCGFGFVNTDISDDFPAQLFSLPIYIDNLRVVPNKSVTISDFDD